MWWFKAGESNEGGSLQGKSRYWVIGFGVWSLGLAELGGTSILRDRAWGGLGPF